jgi:hypothetical protein
MASKEPDQVEVTRVEHVVQSIAPDKNAVNILLAFSCFACGAASFLFGYDDKVISPVVALPGYVRISDPSFIFHLTFLR